MAIRVGISGWRYPSWRGEFYPAGLVQRRELEYASRIFPSIEINGSFYSLQPPERWALWAAQTPADFLFAVKAPRFITHVKRLRGIDKPLANFFASGVLRLGAKLGPLLWQLPPSQRFEPDLIEDFLAMLPHDTDAALRLARRRERRMRGRVALPRQPRRRLRHALEVRHESFLDPAFVRLLRRHGVGLVIADSAGRFPYAEDMTAGFAYLRLHGDAELYVSGYSAAALARWAKRIRCWSEGGEPRDARTITSPGRALRRREVYCYFDNDAKVRAPFDAIALARRLA
ncbi:DUF72 domain-containing protein [Luteimonas aquatica]|uniref:DUF72 domain-containing protein n=1 Tax=Luteimonas aquatica TaxID=450364 RepID=UPI001F568DD3|nr:DUF72 domain-containing protein [Luteimonas aquatica]